VPMLLQRRPASDASPPAQAAHSGDVETTAA